MATMKRMKLPSCVYLVLFECGAFRVLRRRGAADDTAKYEGRDGLCCGTPGHKGEVFEYVPRLTDAQLEALGASGRPASALRDRGRGKRPSRRGGGLYVIDGGKSK